MRLTPDATVWRVDWQTLADAAVPAAVWTFDRDGDPATGGAAWPAGARVRSAGIDTALVITSRGGRQLDTVTGAALTTVPTTVDVAARSFVVRVPRAVLPAAGAWRVRLGSGIALPTALGPPLPRVRRPVPPPSTTWASATAGAAEQTCTTLAVSTDGPVAVTLSASGGSTPVAVPAGARELLVLPRGRWRRGWSQAARR